MRSAPSGHGQATGAIRNREETTYRRPAWPLAALVTVLLVTLLGAAPASAAPGWLPTKTISGPDGISFQAQIAIDGAGNATAVWQQTAGSDYLVRAAQKPAGQAWQEPVDVSGPVGQPPDPQLAVDPAGNAIAIWDRHIDNFERAIVAARRPAGGSWSPEVMISGEPGDLGSHRIEIGANGDATAIWQRTKNTGTYEVIESARKPAGEMWQDPVSVSDDEPAVVASQPQLAVDADGNATAVWVLDPADPLEETVVRAAQRPWHSASWGPPILLSESDYDAYAPRIGVDAAGNLLALWVAGAGFNYLVHAAARPAGEGWQPAVDVTEVEGQIAWPQIAVSAGGDAVAVWKTTGVKATIEAARGTVSGSWGEAVPIASATGTVGLDVPQVAIGPDGDAVAIWERSTSMGNAGAETAYGPAGGAWDDPIELTPSTTPGKPSPQIAPDPDGNMIAVFGFNDASDPVIQAATFDATGPELRSVSIPTTGTVGKPLHFSADPFDAAGAALSTTWSFGDGDSATGDSATHAYAEPGNYEASVTARDMLGNSTTTTGQVKITKKPTPPSPPSPPPTTADAKAKRQVKVKKGMAIVRLRCPKRGACAGVAKLLLDNGRKSPHAAKRPARKTKMRNATKIGSQRVALDAGEKGKVRIKLNRRGKKALRRAPRGRLKAKLSGTAVKPRSVVLKLQSRRCSECGH